MHITLTGATGFIGRRLVDGLLGDGHKLRILSRHACPGDNPRYFACDLSQSEPPLVALEGAGAIIHLAGEPVAQRWTGEAKRRIRSSRIDGTRHLVDAIPKLDRKPEVLISAAAIGIYGDRGDEVLTEASPPGNGFLEQVAIDWEREADRAQQYGIRVVKSRFGIVLGDGGALSKMLPPFKAGLGGRIGSGRQWMSWIHIEDVTGLIQFALTQSSMSGAVNATSPNPARNEDFTRALANAVRRPALFPVPSFALRLLFGEMAGVLIGGQRVMPQAAGDAGYIFRFPELQAALKNVLQHRA
jgi:hypothetical protein